MIDQLLEPDAKSLSFARLRVESQLIAELARVSDAELAQILRAEYMQCCDSLIRALLDAVIERLEKR